MTCCAKTGKVGTGLYRLQPRAGCVRLGSKRKGWRSTIVVGMVERMVDKAKCVMLRKTGPLNQPPICLGHITSRKKISQGADHFCNRIEASIPVRDWWITSLWILGQSDRSVVLE